VTLASMLNITVDTERPTISIDAYGMPVETFVSSLSSAAFKLDELSARESVLNSRESQTITARGWFVAGADVLPKDTILYDSRTFRVVGVRKIRTPIGTVHHTACDLEELT